MVNREEIVQAFSSSKRRLIVMGFNSALTTGVENFSASKRHFDTIKTLTKIHPDVYHDIKALADQEHTRVVLFSGSERGRLEELFGKCSLPLELLTARRIRPMLKATSSPYRGSANLVGCRKRGVHAAARARLDPEF